MRIGQGGLVMLAVAVLASCGDREQNLPGIRYDTRTPLSETLPADAAGGAAAVLALPGDAPPANRSAPVSLPAAVSPASWPQKGVNPGHRIPNIALAGSLQPVWRVPIGAGNDRRHRVTADPVSDGARIYTLDSRARVTAVTPGGAVAWTADVTPPGDGKDDGSGGGLAVANGRVFVSSGFGAVTALDAATGGVIWTQRIDAVGNASPTVVGDRLYVTGRDNRGWSIRTSDGKVEWTIRGLPAPMGYVGGAGATVDDRIAVFPFAGGQLVSVLRNSGNRTWENHVAGERRGRAYTAVRDIAGDPVLIGTTLYAGNATGRLQAIDAGDGKTRWTALDGTMSPPLVMGNSIFMVSDFAELVRLDAETGERVWGTPLPLFENPKVRKRRTFWTYYGPLMAGGRLLVASADGTIRSFDPASGAQTGQVALPGGAASNPIVVGGTLYVVTTNGQLAAYR